VIKKQDSEDNKLVTHVAIILDRSGSMASCRAETISGFNEQVQKITGKTKAEGSRPRRLRAPLDAHQADPRPPVHRGDHHLGAGRVQAEDAGQPGPAFRDPTKQSHIASRSNKPLDLRRDELRLALK
jgi:hypothetical protein